LHSLKQPISTVHKVSIQCVPIPIHTKTEREKKKSKIGNDSRKKRNKIAYAEFLKQYYPLSLSVKLKNLSMNLNL
jgi:hypothetical protein